MSDLWSTGIRPAIDEYLKKKSEEERDYGEYWSASSAGYCMRLNMLKRLKVPPVPEMEDDAARTTRVFESGHIFHEWIQRITKDAGLSIASEVELQDEDLMIRGHFDDLVLATDHNQPLDKDGWPTKPNRLILYDYKTAHSASFKFKQGKPIGHYHKMQLGTYMYMLRKQGEEISQKNRPEIYQLKDAMNLTEARILSISKDDLRMDEKQLIWTPQLEKEVVGYWKTLNGYWRERKIPACTCLNHDGGFMGKRSAKGKVYNPYFYDDEPCSMKWVEQTLKEGKWQMPAKEDK